MRELKETQLNTFSEILNIAYSDILSTEAWQEIIRLVSKVIDCDAAGIAFFDPDTGKPMKHVTQNIDPKACRLYAEHYYAKDPVTSAALAKGIRVFTPSDIMPEVEYRQTEFYNDLQLPYGLTYPLAAVLGTDSVLPMQFCLVRTEAAGNFSRADVEFLRMLERHFTVAYNNAKLLERISLDNQILQAGVDQYSRPIFHYKDDLQMIRMNSAARNIISSKENQEIFGRAAAELTRKKLEASSDFEYPGGVKCVVDGCTYVLEASSVTPPNGQRYWVAVLVDMTDRLRKTLSMSMNAHDLSAREAEICQMVVGGMSNREIAEKLFISEFTVKDHVKSILGKLKSSNRSQIAPALLGF